MILLHGMARTSGSMKPLARDLLKSGYRVFNVGYPSRPYSVEALVDRYLRPVVEPLRHHGAPLHFVTHSLGGILIRHYLQSIDLPAGSRIVMLAPPNQGSEVADRVRGWPPYRWRTGRVGQQMGTGSDGISHRLGPVRAEIGVIAANRSVMPWFSAMLPGEDDGIVSVESTRLTEMRDFLVVRSSHTLVMFNRVVRRQVRLFLAQGAFDHDLA